MSSSEMPHAILSYARTCPNDKRLAKQLADRLRDAGVDSDIDQYHDVLPRGWLHWMEQRILSPEWFVIVLCSAPLRPTLVTCRGTGNWTRRKVPKPS